MVDPVCGPLSAVRIIVALKDSPPVSLISISALLRLNELQQSCDVFFELYNVHNL